MRNDHINLYIVRFRQQYDYDLSFMVTLGMIQMLIVLQSVYYMIIHMLIRSHIGYIQSVL